MRFTMANTVPTVAVDPRSRSSLRRPPKMVLKGLLNATRVELSGTGDRLMIGARRLRILHPLAFDDVRRHNITGIQEPARAAGSGTSDHHAREVVIEIGAEALRVRQAQRRLGVALCEIISVHLRCTPLPGRSGPVNASSRSRSTPTVAKPETM